MKIGTDIDLSTCKAEGYGIIEYKGKFAPDKQVRFYNYWHEYAGNLAGDINTDTSISWNEAIELYNDNKDNLDSFSDDLPEITQDPCFRNLLRIADTINSYQGLP